MKTKLLILTFLLLTGMVWGQENKIGQNFYLKGSTIHSRTNLKNQNIYDTINKTLNYLEDNVKLKIEDIIGDSIVVIANPSFKEKYERSKYYNNIRYIISKKDYNDKAEEVEKLDLPDRFSIGILTLPFKFRPQDEKTFEAQFNLNSTLNFRMGSLYTTYYYLQLGAGLGSVELNTNNSLGISADKNINAATLTMFSGMMLQYKKVQAGIYIGVDHINNQTNYQWKNNGNIWLGFGIGYQLFNVDLGNGKKENK